MEKWWLLGLVGWWRVSVVGDFSISGGDVFGEWKMMSECLSEEVFRRSWD
jgi:hypothetical protein